MVSLLDQHGIQADGSIARRLHWLPQLKVVETLSLFEASSISCRIQTVHKGSASWNLMGFPAHDPDESQPESWPEACMGSTCSSDARIGSDFEAAQGRQPGELLQAAVTDVIQGRLVIDEQALQPWQHAQRDQIAVAHRCARQVQMQQLLCQCGMLSS